MRAFDLILLPGLDGTGEMFAPLCAALPSHIHPLVVSYPRDEPRTYRELEAQIRETCARRTGDRPLVILGESFSGPLAIRLAANPPPGLTGVILVATFATSPVPQMLRPLVHPLLFSFPQPALSMRHYLVGWDAPADQLPALRQVMSTVSPRVIAARVLEILDVDVTDELRTVDVPILFLAAKRDNLVLARRELLLDCAPRMTWVELDGPHMILQTRTNAARDAISDFAEGLAGGD